MMSNLPTAAGSLDLQVILEIVRVTWEVVVHAIHRRSVESFDEPVQRQGFYTLRMNFKNSVGDLPLNTPRRTPHVICEVESVQNLLLHGLRVVSRAPLQ
jgi:hypothetical protein